MTFGAESASLVAMDTMKFLLGATAALLLGAIFVAWQGMQQGVKNASPDEMKRVKAQIAELQSDVDDLKAKGAGNQPLASAAQDQTKVSPQPTPMNDEIVEFDMSDIGGVASRSDQVESELDKRLRLQEEGLMAQRALERSDAELRRARLISQALLIGRVTDYVDDPQFGGFITLSLLEPQLVEVGTILGIRRKTGILHRFRVSDISPEGAIANPTTLIGSIKPERGDELIFPPRF